MARFEKCALRKDHGNRLAIESFAHLYWGPLSASIVLHRAAFRPGGVPAAAEAAIAGWSIWRKAFGSERRMKQPFGIHVPPDHVISGVAFSAPDFRRRISGSPVHGMVTLIS
ncbi:MAG: hypothetical protein JST22_05070 [Bacteroidetes bacterium]|nr:hypothetical protein [Bacteroidota bacterium]